MTTKERILALLEENRGTPLSGEVLAEELGVSRTAVWKAIKDLQKAGHAIAAAQNRGYTLDTDSEVLSEQGVRLFLRNKSLNLVVAQELESTNLTAKQMAAAGAPHGTLVVADSQTAGRGRRGRSFASPPGTGLYLSMVLRSALPMQSAVLVTSAAAVAVCRAVERAAGKRLDIKWVNDLFYRGKKCCGILTEAAADVETGGVDYLVVGIGLNLLPPEGGWPEELAEIAASFHPVSTWGAAALLRPLRMSFWPFAPRCRIRLSWRNTARATWCPAGTWTSFKTANAGRPMPLPSPTTGICWCVCPAAGRRSFRSGKSASGFNKAGPQRHGEK
ncbi:biotin--[acetyl-CoA-carboxylase] ligase [Ruthenibacterium lactatiformans]|uniref:biotin--[acetyl-CoA-carboxylase] ligase n=3 Tax=Ruthenibacterium lactatiformans TaxID=1550024 RepID=UPI0039A0CFB9